MMSPPPPTSSEKRMLPSFTLNAADEKSRSLHPSHQSVFVDASSVVHGTSWNEDMKINNNASEMSAEKSVSASKGADTPNKQPLMDNHEEPKPQHHFLPSTVSSTYHAERNDSEHTSKHLDEDMEDGHSQESNKINEIKIEKETEGIRHSTKKEDPRPSRAIGGNASRDKIVNPESTDVLFGRGKPYQGHCGNQKLREIVENYKGAYMGSRRYDKLAIAEEIVKGIQGGRWGEAGRFLRRAENGDDFWVVAPDEEAREKVSHALRGKKKTITVPSPAQYTSSSITKEKNMSIHRSHIDDVLNSPGQQQSRTVQDISSQQQAPRTQDNTAAEVLNLGCGAPLGLAHHDPRSLLLGRGANSTTRPIGVGGMGLLSPLDLQNFLMSSHHQNHQHLLRQHLSLVGGEKGRSTQDMSMMGSSNPLLAAAQLGLLGPDQRHSQSIQIPSISQFHQQALVQQQMNQPANMLGRSHAVLGNRSHPSQVSPLISALLGQRAGQDGTRPQQHPPPSNTPNIADVVRELQQVREQNALAEFILRKRAGSGSFTDGGTQK